MSSYEYKTVALPRAIAARPRRRQSEADLVAEQLGQVINEEAVDGWQYLRAETLTTPGRKGMFQKSAPAAYIVLVFYRDRAVDWTDTDQNGAEETEAKPEATPDPSSAMQSAPAAGAASPDLRIASTSGQTAPRQEPSISPNGTPAAPASPGQPLGTAAD